MTENPNNCAINRRPIVDFVQRGVFDAELLSHLSRYGKAVDLIRQESKRLKRPIKVLDIGCGELWPLRSMVGNPFIREDQLLERYYAVDIEQPDTEFVSKRTPLTIIRQDLTVQPNFKTTIADGEIDLIICFEFIEHINKPFALPLLDEMKRVLAPGGMLFLSTPNDDHGREQDEFHVYEWKFAELKEELTNRFELVDCWGTFMRQNSVKKANRETGIAGSQPFAEPQAAIGVTEKLPESLLTLLRQRFDPTWYRVITAALFPEASENVAWLLTKPTEADTEEELGALDLEG